MTPSRRLPTAEVNLTEKMAGLAVSVRALWPVSLRYLGLCSGGSTERRPSPMPSRLEHAPLLSVGVDLRENAIEERWTHRPREGKTRPHCHDGMHAPTRTRGRLLPGLPWGNRFLAKILNQRKAWRYSSFTDCPNSLGHNVSAIKMWLFVVTVVTKNR